VHRLNHQGNLCGVEVPAGQPPHGTIQAQAVYVRDALGRISPSLRFEYVVHLVDRLSYILRTVHAERLPGLQRTTSYAAVDRLLADLRGRVVNPAPLASIARRARRLQPLAEGQVPAGWRVSATFYVGLLAERLALVDLDVLTVPRNDGSPEPLDLMAWEVVTSLLSRSETRLREDLPLDSRSDRPLVIEYEREREELERLLIHRRVDDAMMAASRTTAADIGAVLVQLGFGDEVHPAVRDAQPPTEPPMW
jgi:hypothetical protein